MQKWFLPTLSEVLARSESAEATSFVSQIEPTLETENDHRRAFSRTVRERVKAEREWCGAIAALEQLLLQTLDFLQVDSFKDSPSAVKGLVLAGPVPVLSHPAVLSHFQRGIFTTEGFNPLALMPFQLPPGTQEQESLANNETFGLSLLPADPLAAEQFCLVLTAKFSLVMVLGEQLNGVPAFLFSFDPDVVQQAWVALRGRIILSCPDQLRQLSTLVEQFPTTPPDYRTVMQFTRQLLQHLPEEAEEQANRVVGFPHPEEADGDETPHPKSTIQNLKSDDLELLQAFAHEVRTPLTTIRTLTRLLLKRRDLAPDIIKRLEIIDHECTEQIDRMELIFRAVELETAPVKQVPVHLTAMSLGQVFQHSIPRWQKQASRRNLTLDVVLPQNLPTVVSNPVMLDQVLTGLIENFTRNVPSGGHIQVEVTPAGDQLKLQLQSQPNPDEVDSWKTMEKNPPIRKSIGQLLMFQPETGCLSLNFNVTKNLFQALGGKLVVRQRPQQGEVLTIFLPLQ